MMARRFASGVSVWMAAQALAAAFATYRTGCRASATIGA
jgi:hypothetical protein